MALSKGSHIGRLIATTLRPLRAPYAHQQRRWAQVHDVRFLATAHPQAVVEKYREKLDQKAKDEGLRDVEELREAYADKIANLRRKDAVDFAPAVPKPTADAPPTPTSTAASSPASTGSPKPKASSPSTTTGVKPLSEILDLDKARHLPNKELSAIWRLRHASSPLSLCATIPAATYEAMERAARATPRFVLPVPHPEQGAEIHYLQWTFDGATRTSTVLFTQLAEYKARGEFAQPHTTVTHHTDLAGERGLVLMQGQVVEGRGAKPADAQFLVMCLQKFYGGWDVPAGEGSGAERRRLLEWFASGDQRFTVEKLLEETEKLV